MVIRQKALFNNIVVAALYLDPRYQLLDSDDRKRAQMHLSSSYKRINQNADADVSEVSASSAIIIQGNDYDLNNYDREFENFLSRASLWGRVSHIQHNKVVMMFLLHRIYHFEHNDF